MSALRFDHITAIVADAEAAAEAMTRLLGAGPVERVNLPGMAIRTFKLGDGELHVNAPTGPGPVEDHYRKHGAGLHHLALLVPDLDATLVELASRGFTPRGVPVETAPGLREVFLDPATAGGLLIQLVERRSNAGARELDAAEVDKLASQSRDR